MSRIAVDRGLLARLLQHAIEQRDQYRADQLHTLADLAETDMEAARALLAAPGAEEPTCNHCGATLDPERAYADPLGSHYCSADCFDAYLDTK